MGRREPDAEGGWRSEGEPARRHDWGERLSDRIRRALEAGDLGTARRLAVEGDGQARSLAKEYALMYKGLGAALRVMIPLAAETVAPGAGRGDEAQAALRVLLARFRADLGELLARAYPDAATAAGAEARDGARGPGEASDPEATLGLLAAAERLFDREQARLAAEVVAALDAGDARRARAALDRKERGQYVPLHDRLVRLMAELMGLVLARVGPEALYRFHRATAEGQRRGFEQWERLGPEAFARATAFLLRQHMGAVEVSEDAEKFTVVQRPCGSGGRLRLAGAYAGPDALPFAEGPGPLTAGQARMPVYCSHCPVWNGVAPLEWFGHPQWVLEEPARPDGSCTLHIYRDPARIPAEALRRLGAGGARG